MQMAGLTARLHHGKAIQFRASRTDDMIPLIVGVTSHRNIPAREVESIRLRVRDFFARLQREFPHSALVVLSALAEGGDQIAAQEALAVGAQVIAPLPLSRDLYAQDFAHAAARAAFDALCERAHLIEMPLLPGHTLEEVALAGVERDSQYARAGVFIARHCHLLLTIWDGKQSDRLGGTAQVVDYYLHGIMPGLIERRRGARRWLFGYGDERPVCHLVCSRDGADGAPPAPLQAGQILWRTAGSVSAPDVPMPARFRNAFAEAGEFNADAAKYQAQIDASPADPVERGAPPALATLFRAADWLAMHFQRRVLLAMRDRKST